METPARIDLHADRWVACIREFAIVGEDLTGATFSAQVRALPDAPGTPLVDLGTVATAAAEGIRLIYAGTDTITNHISAGRLDAVPPGYSAEESLAMSSLGLRINETTMEAIPEPDDAGAAIRFAWDLHITPATGVKDKYCGGDFVVRPGVTH
jgi:hypothetical protein